MCPQGPCISHCPALPLLSSLYFISYWPLFEFMHWVSYVCLLLNSSKRYWFQIPSFPILECPFNYFMDSSFLLVSFYPFCPSFLFSLSHLQYLKFLIIWLQYLDNIVDWLLLIPDHIFLFHNFFIAYWTLRIKNHSDCYGLNCVSCKFICQCPNPSKWLFGDRGFKEIIKVKQIIRVGL